MSRFRFIVPVLLLLGAVAGPQAALGQVAVGVNITLAPPPLPVYVQPVIPAPGYIWIPGYWAYGPDGYYWVPGTWVLAPAVGLLWTPAWWGWNDGFYVFYPGYWGPEVGFYGGINYGYGYGGVGYQGGYWNHGVFAYNRTVNNLGNVHIANVYSRPVTYSTTSHVSFNGGQGGLTARPTPREEAYAHEAHTPPTALQTQHQQAASTNHALLATVNNGRPPITATSRPGAFTGRGIVPTGNVVGPTHGAPGPAAPAVVHPQAAPQVREASPPHPQAAPVQHPQAAPAPRVEPHPAPQHEEKKPPG